MSDITTLRQLGTVVNEFRKIYQDIPATTISVFLAVAVKPGISSQTLLKEVGVSQSAVSRHLSMLGTYSWKGGEGWGLVESIDDPENRRVKISFLTPTGRVLAMKLIKIMFPKGDAPSMLDFPTAQEWLQSGRRGAR